MKTLYCKKADLVLISRLGKKTYKPEFYIYFLPAREDYTLPEIESKIRGQKEKIIERLEEKFKSHVAMTVRGYPVEKINVKEETHDFIVTDAGIISKQAVIIEI
jgi:hypothetical protein